MLYALNDNSEKTEWKNIHDNMIGDSDSKKKVNSGVKTPLIYNDEVIFNKNYREFLHDEIDTPAGKRKYVGNLPHLILSILLYYAEGSNNNSSIKNMDCFKTFKEHIKKLTERLDQIVIEGNKKDYAVSQAIDIANIFYDLFNGISADKKSRAWHKYYVYAIRNFAILMNSVFCDLPDYFAYIALNKSLDKLLSLANNDEKKAVLQNTKDNLAEQVFYLVANRIIHGKVQEHRLNEKIELLWSSLNKFVKGKIDFSDIDTKLRDIGLIIDKYIKKNYPKSNNKKHKQLTDICQYIKKMRDLLNTFNNDGNKYNSDNHFNGGDKLNGKNISQKKAIETSNVSHVKKCPQNKITDTQMKQNCENKLKTLKKQKIILRTCKIITNVLTLGMAYLLGVNIFSWLADKNKRNIISAHDKIESYQNALNRNNNPNKVQTSSTVEVIREVTSKNNPVDLNTAEVNDNSNRSRLHYPKHARWSLIKWFSKGRKNKHKNNGEGVKRRTAKESEKNDYSDLLVL